jgi:hypothetical protein
MPYYLNLSGYCVKYDMSLSIMSGIPLPFISYDDSSLLNMDYYVFRLIMLDDSAIDSDLIFYKFSTFCPFVNSFGTYSIHLL